MVVSPEICAVIVVDPGAAAGTKDDNTTPLGMGTVWPVKVSV